MNVWIALVLSLPTENATARMRAWRALKASGAAVLRDGVYLLPQRDGCRALLAGVADEVRSSGGSAHLLQVGAESDAAFAALFDRSDDCAALLADITSAGATLDAGNALDVLKQTRKLAKTLASLIDIDYFPGEARRQTVAALEDLQMRAHAALSPGEPHPSAREIPRLAAASYLGRVWATRQRPWIDRLACAWLIRRHIDPQARFLWLTDPADCPANALGFDFDGAAFSHVGAKVTFEVLLAGLREAIDDDDQLMLVASGVFEGLRVAFESETKTP